MSDRYWYRLTDVHVTKNLMFLYKYQLDKYSYAPIKVKPMGRGQARGGDFINMSILCKYV